MPAHSVEQWPSRLFSRKTPMSERTFPDHWHPSTRALHVGHEPVQHHRSATVPIYQSTSFVFDDAAHARSLFNLEQEGYLYSRTGNPTLNALELRIAALEGGVGALAVASGMAAIDYALSALAQSGDHVIALTELYGGTYNFFRHLLPRRGIEVSLIGKDDLAALEAAIKPNTKAVLIEPIGNPGAGIVDVDAVTAIAHRHGVAVIADNTVASPLMLRPIDHGVDIVVHSATKYIGGHGSTIGGLIIDSGRFDWSAHAERYPQFSTPDHSYHGLQFVEAFAEQAYIIYVRAILLRNLGAAMAPNSAFLLLQGLETLSLRLRQIADNTRQVLDFLQAHPAVKRVSHPALPSHPDHAFARRYLQDNLVPGILSFELTGGQDAARALYDALHLFLRLVNIGDNKSLVTLPAETTHRQLAPEQLAAIGIAPGLVRLSIGIEHADDLIADLNQALEIAVPSRPYAKAA